MISASLRLRRPCLQANRATREKSPPADSPLLTGQIGYHLRTGGHDVLPYDWEQFMNFTDRHFGQKQ